MSSGMKHGEQSGYLSLQVCVKVVATVCVVLVYLLGSRDQRYLSLQVCVEVVATVRVVLESVYSVSV